MTDFKKKMQEKRISKYVEIMVRATKMGLMKPNEYLERMMDIESADIKFKLRLNDLLNANDSDFTYDFIGIRNSIKRDNGFPATDFGLFVPKFEGGEVKE